MITMYSFSTSRNVHIKNILNISNIQLAITTYSKSNKYFSTNAYVHDTMSIDTAYVISALSAYVQVILERLVVGYVCIIKE